MEEESKAYRIEGFMQTYQWSLYQSQSLFPIATLSFVSLFIFNICAHADGHLIDKCHIEHR